MDGPSNLNFDKSKDHWRPDVDYRAHPEEYRVGRGEQGVLICEPYKGEMVPHWRFKHQLEKGTGDPLKAESAAIFYEAWQKAEAKPAYVKMKAEWKLKYG